MCQLLEGRNRAQGMVTLPLVNCVALGKSVKVSVSSSVSKVLSLVTNTNSARLRTPACTWREPGPHEEQEQEGPTHGSFILGGGERGPTLHTT